MRILRFIQAMFAHAYYEWAEREIAPTHPDVLKVQLRRLHWRERLETF
jgi:hypothetical protein